MHFDRERAAKLLGAKRRGRCEGSSDNQGEKFRELQENPAHKSLT